MAGPWDDTRVERLIQLWNDGHSASKIAAFIGDVSRNAVIGKVHRLGLTGRHSTRPPTTLFYTSHKLPKPAQINCAAKPMVAKYAPGPAGGITFAQLEEGMCKFPIGDPKDDGFCFCGAGRPFGTPYCDHHTAIAHNKCRPTGASNYFTLGGCGTKKKAA
jgi:GcrA cell cycle regulator